MPSLDEVGVRLKATGGREAQREIRGVRDEVSGVARAARDVGAPEVGRGLGDLSGRFGALRGELGGLHSGLLTASSSLQTFTARGILGLGALSATATGFGLRAASGFEQSRIAFGTLLGDMQQGEALFGRLQQFNLQTPFELPDLTGATQQLLQYGFAGEQAFSTIRTVSDIAATSGARANENLGRITYALGQIRNQGTLRADDIRQLTDAGFPALNLLSEVSGLTGQEIRKNLETGLDPKIAQDFLAAVETGQAQTFARFRGGAAAQARTLSGIYSNLKDTIQVRLADAVNPLADSLADDVPLIATSLGELIDATVPPIGELVSALAKGAPDGIRRLTPALVGLADAGLLLVTEVGPMMPELIDLFADFLGLLPDILGVATDLLPVLSGTVDVFSDFLALPFGSEAASVLLVTLLGYRALAGIAGAVTTFAAALDVLTGAQTRNALAPGGTGVPPAGGAGRGAKFARGGGGALLVGGGLMGGPSLLGDAGTIGGAALTGSVFGPIGAAVGGAIGTGVVVGRRLAASDREDAAALAPAVPSGAGASEITYSRQTTVAPGAVTVLNPTSNVDVAQAVQDGIRAHEEEQDRRN